jgi:hypothetical protein
MVGEVLARSEGGLEVEVNNAGFVYTVMPSILVHGYLP